MEDHHIRKGVVTHVRQAIFHESRGRHVTRRRPVSGELEVQEQVLTVRYAANQSVAVPTASDEQRRSNGARGRAVRDYVLREVSRADSNTNHQSAIPCQAPKTLGVQRLSILDGEADEEDLIVLDIDERKSDSDKIFGQLDEIATQLRSVVGPIRQMWETKLEPSIKTLVLPNGESWQAEHQSTAESLLGIQQSLELLNFQNTSHGALLTDVHHRLLRSCKPNEASGALVRHDQISEVRNALSNLQREVEAIHSQVVATWPRLRDIRSEPNARGGEQQQDTYQLISALRETVERDQQGSQNREMGQLIGLLRQGIEKEQPARAARDVKMALCHLQSQIGEFGSQMTTDLTKLQMDVERSMTAAREGLSQRTAMESLHDPQSSVLQQILQVAHNIQAQQQETDRGYEAALQQLAGIVKPVLTSISNTASSLQEAAHSIQAQVRSDRQAQIASAAVSTATMQPYVDVLRSTLQDLIPEQPAQREPNGEPVCDQGEIMTRIGRIEAMLQQQQQQHPASQGDNAQRAQSLCSAEELSAQPKAGALRKASPTSDHLEFLRSTEGMYADFRD